METLPIDPLLSGAYGYGKVNLWCSGYNSLYPTVPANAGNMGHIYVEAALEGIRGKKVMRALVDTGATYTVIDKMVAEEIGVVHTPWREDVQLADGQGVEAEIALARVRILDRAFTVKVLVMKAPEPLIGVDTLESLGLRVDPTTGRIEHSRGFLARV